MEEIKLGHRKIGPKQLPFIIAEAGINHEGQFDKAIKMVDAAKETGADCVKFQCHIAEAEMIKTDIRPGGKERLWDIIKRCELSEKEERKIKSYCDEIGIIYLCTPFSREAADRLQAMDVFGFKIGSGECNNIPLLEHIAKYGKPIILSTGMNNIESIRESVNIIKKYNCPIMLMHCTSIYPTPYEKVRLRAIKELQETFDLPVGLSDHSIGIYTCLGAIAIGACAVEKHFTITRRWPGPDVAISIEPYELAELVTGAKSIFKAMGGGKNVLHEEKSVIKFAYASVVSINDIKKGDVFSMNNIWTKRPGTGEIRAKDFKLILGETAKMDIEKDHQLTWEMIND